MSRHFSESFYGHVRVTVSGRLVEQFINRCVREGVRIWDVRRLNRQAIVFSMLASDVAKVRPILKATDCRIHFRERKGLPFIIKKLLSRKGVVAGFVIFFAVLFILSNMIWRINITGADPKLEFEIQSILTKMDIHRGAFQFLVSSPQETEELLSAKLKKVTWVGVSLDGTTLNIKVVQKAIPKKKIVTGPQSLYAKKEAIIHHLFVEKGQAMVKSDDFVKKGDLLVSGKIGKEDKPKYVAAKGKVIGETWYHSVTEVPLQSKIISYTGNTDHRYKLSLFGWKIPVWGFKQPDYRQSQSEVISRPFHFLQWNLPISLIHYIDRETIETTKSRTVEEAVKLGKADALKTLKRKIPKDATIQSEKIWRKESNNGIVKLIIYYVVNEDIAEAKPLNQGD